MSTHRAPEQYPTRIDWNRYCKNGQPVNGSFERLLHDQCNHILGQRRKYWLWRPIVYSSIAASSLGTINLMYFAGHTGHGVSRIELHVAAALADSASATDPYIDFTLTDGISGGSTSTSGQFHYGANGAGTSPADTIDEWGWGRVYIDTVSPDTFYRGIIRVNQYARIAGALVYEIQDDPVDTADGAIDPRIGPGGAILDGDLKTLNEGLTDIWRHNAGPILTWSQRSSASAPTHSGTTYTNPFDSTTSVSASSLGVNVDLQYHNTVSQSTVPVKVVVCASRTSGAGTTSNNVVRFTDGSNNIDISGIDNSTLWYQTTGTMPATNGQKWDVHIKTDAADTVKLRGIFVFEYQA